MSPTLVTWLLLASTIALSATIAILLIPRAWQEQRPDLATCKACLEAIQAQLKRGELSETEADAARLALLAGPQSTRWELAKALRGRAGMMTVPAAAFLLAAGMGGAASYFGQSHDATDAGLPGDGIVAGLVNYTRSLRSGGPAANAPGGELLPDVSTMIGRLEARLEAAPEDVKGWRMLGWSYFHTGHYEQALAAFGKAVELDPQSSELKRLYEEAKAKVSEGGNAQTASAPDADAGGRGAGGHLMKRPTRP